MAWYKVYKKFGLCGEKSNPVWVNSLIRHGPVTVWYNY